MTSRASEFAAHIAASAPKGAAHTAALYLAEIRAERVLRNDESSEYLAAQVYLYADGSALLVDRFGVRAVDAVEAIRMIRANSFELTSWLMRAPHRALRECGRRLTASAGRP